MGGPGKSFQPGFAIHLGGELSGRPPNSTLKGRTEFVKHKQQILRFVALIVDS